MLFILYSFYCSLVVLRIVIAIPEFPGFFRSRNSGILQDIISEILKNVNAKNAMMSIN